MSAVIELITELKEKGIQLSLTDDDNLAVKGNKSALTNALLAQVKALKPQLLACLQAHIAQDTKSMIRKRHDLSSPVVTSFAQQRLWLIDQMEGHSSHYNMPMVLHLRGMVDETALNLAFHQLIERHESLRTYFVVDDVEQPMQVIRQAPDFIIASEDLAGLHQAERQRKLDFLIHSERQTTFNLTQDLMLRARLLRVAEQEYFLLVTMHHIAADGWSLGIFIHEFKSLYQSALTQKPANLAPLAIQYADYAVWQRDRFKGQFLEKQLRYWTEQLALLPAVHNLPLDYPRPAIQSFIGAIYQAQLNCKVTAALKQLCLKAEATLFMGLHAAFSVLLARYSNDIDIVIGTPTANREQPEINDLIGFFVNNLVLRSDLSGEPNFLSLLKQSRDNLLLAYQHQQVPFEQIVEQLKPERSLSYSPLFQIMLTLQKATPATFSLAQVQAELVTPGEAIAKYDLTLNVEESDQHLLFNWEYNVALFEPSTIAAMADNFITLLASLTEAPEQNVYALPMLSEKQISQLDAWNQTKVPFPNSLCIHELFEQMVTQYPEHIAVVDQDSTMSYRQLNNKSNQLAHYLIEQHAIQPGNLVGICFDRSIEMVIAVLATLKAGGAYVPFDPSYPISRLSQMVDDAQVQLVMTTSNVEAAAVFSNSPLLLCDNCLGFSSHQWPDFSGYPKENLDRLSRGLTPSSVAYVIYTSGSTGRPKGVMIEHRNLTSYHANIAQRYEIQPQDNVLQFSTVCFDIFIEELFGALCNGASLILRDEECLKSAHAFNQFCRQHQISVASLPTAFWHQINAHDDKINSPTLKKIILGGEALSKSAVNQYFSQVKHISLINTYGPTEATITACGISFDATSAERERIPIGCANVNNQLYILNQSLQRCPIGVVGELYIAGEGLARGYLNQPELTNTVFIKHTFVDSRNQFTEQRLYKTGDMVKFLPEGNVAFIGRMDDQVKIRGFRIELGEVANHIIDIHGVESAIVLTKSSELGDKKLVAYIKLSHEQHTSENKFVAVCQQQMLLQIQQHLTATLPNYMVPKSFVFIDYWPLTPNGKVDKKSLFDWPELSVTFSYTPPNSVTAVKLAQIWASLLQLEQSSISLYANFFELGGHSLLIGHLVNKITQVFGCELSIVDIYQHQNLNEMAQYLLKLTEPLAPVVAATMPKYLIHLKTGAPEYSPLFLVPPVGGNMTQYIELSRLIDFPGDVYCFNSHLVVADSIEEMAAKYVESMRTVQPQGRYFLGGWSMGGIVALEISSQLKAYGAQVPKVLMIDSFAPTAQVKDQPLACSQKIPASDIITMFVQELDLHIVDSELMRLERLNEHNIEQLLLELLEHAKLQRKLPQDYPLQELLTRYQFFERDSRILSAYMPPSFGGTIALIRASENSHEDERLGWGFYAANVHVSRSPGDHYSMFSQRYLTDLAAQVNAHIEEWIACAN